MSYITFFDHPPLEFQFFGGYPLTESQISYDHPPVEFLSHFVDFFVKSREIPPTRRIQNTESQKSSDHPHVEFFKGVRHPRPQLFKWNSPYITFTIDGREDEGNI